MDKIPILRSNHILMACEAIGYIGMERRPYFDRPSGSLNYSDPFQYILKNLNNAPIFYYKYYFRYNLNIINILCFIFDSKLFKQFISFV
jgi:hypothetical protein